MAMHSSQETVQISAGLESSGVWSFGWTLSHHLFAESTYLKEMKSASYCPSDWGGLAATSHAVFSPALKTLLPRSGHNRTKHSSTNYLHLSYPYQRNMFVTGPQNEASYLLLGMKIWVTKSTPLTSLKIARSRWTDCTDGLLLEASKRRADDWREKRWLLLQLNVFKVSGGNWISKLQQVGIKALPTWMG